MMGIEILTMTTFLAIGLTEASEGWNLLEGHGNGGWDSGELTLGEISLEDHGYKLPTITLGNSGHDNPWKAWPGSSTIGSDWSGISSGYGWQSDGAIGNGWEGSTVPIVKHIGIPVRQEVEIKIPQLVPKNVPQPYPVLVPVSKPEPFEVIKTVVKTVEKKVPTPVERVIPVKVEKPVPFTVYKSVPYPVIKHVPIKIPVHKTIHHYSHGHYH